MMDHPTHEQWMDYLYREADPETRRRLAAHLEECGECTELVRGWQAAMGLLDEWRIPADRPVGAQPLQLMVRAAAALLLVALGAGLGCLAALGPVRRTVAASVAAEVRTIAAERLAADRDLLCDEVRDAIEGELRAETVGLTTRAVAASAAAMAELLADQSRTAETQRRDQLSLAAALWAMWQEQAAYDQALQQDLLTLAAATDGELSRTRRYMAQLAGYADPGPGGLDVHPYPSTSDERS
jgi:hypothetical protein